VIAPVDPQPLNYYFNIVSDLMRLFKGDNSAAAVIHQHPHGLTYLRWFQRYDGGFLRYYDGKPRSILLNLRKTLLIVMMP